MNKWKVGDKFIWKSPDVNSPLDGHLCTIIYDKGKAPMSTSNEYGIRSTQFHYNQSDIDTKMDYHYCIEERMFSADEYLNQQTLKKALGVEE